MSKQITFDEMLRANGLPPIGERIVTPKGDRVEVVKYVFDAYENRVKVRLIDTFDCVVDWTFDMVKKCTWEEKDETVFD